MERMFKERTNVAPIVTDGDASCPQIGSRGVGQVGE
jgi:hypothetical protein